MAPPVVDLRSDTVTKPSPEMRSVMAEADVGDHVLGDDPTASELEGYAAEILGKEQALFFPSGTMANQTAIHFHSSPGSDVLAMEGAHIAHYEENAAAAWSGVQIRELPWKSATSEDLAEWPRRLAPASKYNPRTSLVCLENTHNSSGGRIVPESTVAAISEESHRAGIPVHLDGARLPNAAVASGVSMRGLADHADTVSMALSKGLGAPIGSVLAGSHVAMEECWRIRRRFGGAMRQVGIVAAAGLYALRNNLDRLAEDHVRATALADGLSAINGLACAPPQTNIVMIDLERSDLTPTSLCEKLAVDGVWVIPFGPRRVRAITHLGIDDGAIERAIRAFRRICDS